MFIDIKICLLFLAQQIRKLRPTTPPTPQRIQNWQESNRQIWLDSGAKAQNLNNHINLRSRSEEDQWSQKSRHVTKTNRKHR